VGDRLPHRGQHRPRPLHVRVTDDRGHSGHSEPNYLLGQGRLSCRENRL
jgi:hypothetical protein